MKKKLLGMGILFALLASTLLVGGNAQTAVQPRPSGLLLLGDSITTGYGLPSGAESYGQQLAQALGLSGSKCVNLAHNGDTSADLLRKLSDPDTEAAVRSADTIVISIGGNDFLEPFFTVLQSALGDSDNSSEQLLSSIAENPSLLSKLSAAMQNSDTQALFASSLQGFSANLPRIISGIRTIHPGAHIYLQTVYNPFSGLTGFDALTSSAEGILGKLDASITQEAAADGYTAVDIHGLFSGRAPALTNIMQLDVHPNTEGHTVIFNAVYTAITGKIYNSITLDTKSYRMPAGGRYQIGVTLTGTKAATVKCTSTNSRTAAVTKLKNGNYLVTGTGAGTAYIMFDVYDSKSALLTHASVRVDIKPGIRPEGDSTRQVGKFQ